MVSVLVEKAINAVLESKSAFCKFLSANDSGETGGHQAGILISVSAIKLFFTEQELTDNHILKKYGTIKWNDDYVTNCTVTWYKSKKEVRITGFGRGNSILRSELTGALFVLIKESQEDYQGFFFNTDDDIQEFLNSFGLTPAETNKQIELNLAVTEERETEAIDAFINSLKVDFPSSYEMSTAAQRIQSQLFYNHSIILSDPDKVLLSWTDMEYKIFRAIEQKRYGNTVAQGFKSLDDFISLANQVLNRRKSRAGKSLEHHLSAIFDENGIRYTAQAITEGNKKPDFLFPSEASYHDISFPTEKLCTLAAKTTCKDRWRQILNEADRLRAEHKFLCTMQQGISSAQMDEMQSEKVILVVPKPYIKSYPRDRQDRIWTIGKFIDYIKELQR